MSLVYSGEHKPYKTTQNGAYFVTICTHNRKTVFWDVGATCGRPNGFVCLSQFGRIVDNEIVRISSIYSNTQIDKYVIMPNHIHMIILLGRHENDQNKWMTDDQRSSLQYHVSFNNLKALSARRSVLLYGIALSMTILLELIGII